MVNTSRDRARATPMLRDSRLVRLVMAGSGVGKEASRPRSVLSPNQHERAGGTVGVYQDRRPGPRKTRPQGGGGHVRPRLAREVPAWATSSDELFKPLTGAAVSDLHLVR